MVASRNKRRRSAGSTPDDFAGRLGARHEDELPRPEPCVPSEPGAWVPPYAVDAALTAYRREGHRLVPAGQGPLTSWNEPRAVSALRQGSDAGS